MVDPIFNMFKIKFDILDSWKALKGVTKARIYISLETVLKVLYSERLNNFLVASGDKTDTQRCFVSNIINLAQHYRLYCAKHKIENEIYLYWNYPYRLDFINKKYNNEYRSYYCNKMHHNDSCYYISEVMDSIIDQLQTIIKYVNQVYLITSTEVESSVIPYIIYRDQKDDTVKNIIVSNSKYDFQYISYGFDIWIPDRDDSLLLNKDNVIEYLKERNHVSTQETVPINYIAFIVSLLGDRYRNIQKMNGVGLSRIIKMINQGLKQLIITENTTNIDLLASCIKDEYKEIFKNNYHCTNLAYQYEDISGSIERSILDQIEDKYDDNALQYLNDKYFKEHLIMMIDTKRDQIYHSMMY